MIKIPKLKTKNKIISFFKKKKLNFLIKESQNNPLNSNQLISKEPYRPEIYDLYILYWIIKLNKRITSLEFGSGWSSLIIAIALFENKLSYFKQTINLRRNNKFKNFILENEKKYLNLTKKKIYKYNKSLLKHSVFNFSKCRVKKLNFNYVTMFDKLPKVNPDFIYLDGPDQFNIISEKDSFNIDSKDLTPMAADILKIEFFLNPGTIILVDGRGPNVNFLKRKFLRKWKYKYLKNLDQHIFYLDEKPYGIHSKNLIKFFYKK